MQNNNSIMLFFGVMQKFSNEEILLLEENGYRYNENHTYEKRFTVTKYNKIFDIVFICFDESESSFQAIMYQYSHIEDSGFLRSSFLNKRTKMKIKREEFGNKLKEMNINWLETLILLENGILKKYNK